MPRTAAAKAARLAKRSAGWVHNASVCGSGEGTFEHDGPAANNEDIMGGVIASHISDGSLQQLSAEDGKVSSAGGGSSGCSDDDVMSRTEVMKLVSEAKKDTLRAMRGEMRDILAAWGDSMVAQVRSMSNDIVEAERRIAAVEHEVVDIKVALSKFDGLQRGELKRVNKLKQNAVEVERQLDELRESVLEWDCRASKVEWDALQSRHFARKSASDDVELQSLVGLTFNLCGLGRRRELNGTLCFVLKVLDDGEAVQVKSVASKTLLRATPQHVHWPAMCFGCGGEICGQECFGCSFADKLGPGEVNRKDALDCDSWKGSSMQTSCNSGFDQLAVGSGPQSVESDGSAGMHMVKFRDGCIDGECRAVPPNPACGFNGFGDLDFDGNSSLDNDGAEDAAGGGVQHATAA